LTLIFFVGFSTSSFLLTHFLSFAFSASNMFV
jgi:hypothetical protein